MGESIKMGTAKYQFMSYIKSLKDVNNMDWCGYIVECLNKQREIRMENRTSMDR